MPKLNTLIDFFSTKSSNKIIKTIRELNVASHDIKSIIRNIKPDRTKEEISKKELEKNYKANQLKHNFITPFAPDGALVDQTPHHPEGSIRFSIELMKFVKGTKDANGKVIISNKIIPFYPGSIFDIPSGLQRNKRNLTTLPPKVDFWATFESLNESVSPQWESKLYFGRTEGVHHLTSTERTLNTNFTLHANNEQEHEFNMERINFLTKLTFPGKVIVDSGSNLMSRQPPIIRITIGDLYVDQFAKVDSLSKDFDPNIPWANTVKELPVMTKIDMTFTLLHEEQPTLETEFHTFNRGF